MLGSANTVRRQEPVNVVLQLGFIRSEKFIWIGSQIRVTLWNHAEDCQIYWFDVLGLPRSDHGELCSPCIFFIRYGDNLVLLPWLLYSRQLIDFERENSKLAVSVNFSNGFAVPVVFLSQGWSTKGVIIFVVLSSIVRASAVMLCWGSAVVSLEAVLTCIFICGNCMRPCVVSMTTVVLHKMQLCFLGLLISSLRRSVQQFCCLQFQIKKWLFLMVSLTGPLLFGFENWEGRRFLEY